MRISHPVVAPRPHPRVVEGTVEGARVLFHLDDRRLHVLNPSAGAIWDELGHASTVADVALGVADRFAIEPSSVGDDVQRLLDRFRADGLVTVDDRVTAVRCARPHPVAVSASPGVPATGSYRALGTDLAIVCADTEIAAVLDRVLAPLHVSACADTSIRIDEEPGGTFTVATGDRPPVRAASRLSVVHTVLAEVNGAAVRSVPDHLVFHAGAVTGDPGAVLLPAGSNHGKSTLTTALVRAGFGYLTDEAAAVSSGTVVRPFAKSIVLDPGSFPLFPQLEPAEPHGLGRALAAREWHLDASRLGSVAGPTPVRVVVCPHWRAGATTRVHRCSPTEAMHLLLGEAFDFAEGGQAVFDLLTTLVASVPVYRLGYSDLAEAVDRVASLVVDPG